MPLALQSRRCIRAATLAALTVAYAITGCRTTDDTRVAPPPTIERRSHRAAIVDVERIPGGRPGGRGDPRRYSAIQGRDTRRTADPAGSYDLSFTDDGKPMTGSMIILGTPGEYTGRINADGRPEVQISTVTASGRLVTVTADVPNGVLLLRFRVTGDSLHGDWSLRNDGGRLVGARRKPARTP